MPIVQKMNKRTKRWQKMERMPNGMFKILDIKQKDPMKPFKGVKKI